MLDLNIVPIKNLIFFFNYPFQTPQSYNHMLSYHEFIQKEFETKKDEVIKKQALRILELESEMVKLNATNLRWSKQWQELQDGTLNDTGLLGNIDDGDYWMEKIHDIFTKNKSTKSCVLETSSIRLENDWIRETIIGRNWSGLKEMCKQARKWATDNGYNNWCRIEFAHSEFLIITKSVFVNEYIQSILEEKITVLEEDFIQDGLNSQRICDSDLFEPYIPPHIKPKFIFRGMCRYCNTAVTTQHPRIKEKYKDSVNYVHEKCHKKYYKSKKKSNPKPTLNIPPKPIFPVKLSPTQWLQKRIDEGYCKKWWESVEVESKPRLSKIKWADKISTDSDESERDVSQSQEIVNDTIDKVLANMRKDLAKKKKRRQQRQKNKSKRC